MLVILFSKIQDGMRVIFLSKIQDGMLVIFKKYNSGRNARHFLKVKYGTEYSSFFKSKIQDWMSVVFKKVKYRTECSSIVNRPARLMEIRKLNCENQSLRSWAGATFWPLGLTLADSAGAWHPLGELRPFCFFPLIWLQGCDDFQCVKTKLNFRTRGFSAST